MGIMVELDRRPSTKDKIRRLNPEGYLKAH
jgi:hypothetical protein